MASSPEDPPGFAELCARSCFSLLEGASQPDELVAMAAALGHAGFGLCDRMSLAGVVRAHVAAREAGLPFALGARLVLQDGPEMLAWPTDRAGYGRLTRLLSAARMAARGEACRLAPDAVEAAAEGWALAVLPPPGLPGAAVAAGLRHWSDRLRGRLALPLLCVGACVQAGDEATRLRRLAAMAEAAGGGLLASTEPRFHTPGRRRLADVMTAIRLGRRVEDLGFQAEPNAERRLKPLAAMRALYRDHPAALDWSLRILRASAGFSLGQLRYEYPHEILEDGCSAQETLEGRVRQAVAARWDAPAPGLLRRLEEELRLIGAFGYAPYFLTVHEIVRFAEAEGILCQGRGSAANSAVCYVLGITAIDPEQHDLLFARFLSAARDEPPDIDVDFEHERREEVIQHIYRRYGRDRAAICATVIRYRPRSALREVGKAMGLSEDVTARLAGAAWGPGREETLPALAAGEGLDPEEPRLALALRLAEELQDFPRHLATHVGGFVITEGPLVELAVVTRAAMEDRTVLEWDKEDIDALGILKVDVLGLGMLSCLRRAFDLLAAHKQLPAALRSLPRECPDTFAMLQRADSVGVFQVESRAQMNMLPRLRPRCFYDLVVQVAIVRPGPIQGGMVHPYLQRRARAEPVVFPSPAPPHPPDELVPVLGRTLGVPLFQEQAMRLAIVAAGFSEAEADRLRRDMGRFRQSGKMDEYRQKLVGGMTARGYERDFAERVFEQIRGFGDYGFPESHAASFAHLVWASAWIKCHHPEVFACALLNSQPLGFYAPAQIVRDAVAHGVTVRPVAVNVSAWDCTLEAAAAGSGGLALRLGLRMVRGLAAVEGQALVRARQAGNGAPFTGPEEALRRAGLSRAALEALAAADAFRDCGMDRRRAAWAVHGTERAPPPLFATQDSLPLLPEPQPRLPALGEGAALVADYRATGLTLGRHPLALLRPTLDALGCDDSRRLVAAASGARLRLAGLVLMRQRPGTSKGVVFLTTEDEHGNANIVVYASLARRDRRALIGARLLIVEGHVERGQGDHAVPILHLIASRLIDRTALLDGLEAEASGSRSPRLQPSRDFR